MRLVNYRRVSELSSFFAGGSALTVAASFLSQSITRVAFDYKVDLGLGAIGVGLLSSGVAVWSAYQHLNKDKTSFTADSGPVDPLRTERLQTCPLIAKDVEAGLHGSVIAAAVFAFTGLVQNSQPGSIIHFGIGFGAALFSLGSLARLGHKLAQGNPPEQDLTRLIEIVAAKKVPKPFSPFDTPPKPVEEPQPRRSHRKHRRRPGPGQVVDKTVYQPLLLQSSMV
ncbi:MAG: hypothetical protein P1U34_01940 [Coxiellaceae bacterium]|nr:hypothetical protein [Coxiellaceae bacterium]